MNVESKRFELTRFDTIFFDTTPAYHIKGLLCSTGLVVVWGPPKCGKSFWVFDLVMHVSLGRERERCAVLPDGLANVACCRPGGARRVDPEHPRQGSARLAWISQLVMVRGSRVLQHSMASLIIPQLLRVTDVVASKVVAIGATRAPVAAAVVVIWRGKCPT